MLQATLRVKPFMVRIMHALLAMQINLSQQLADAKEDENKNGFNDEELISMKKAVDVLRLFLVSHFRRLPTPARRI